MGAAATAVGPGFPATWPVSLARTNVVRSHLYIWGLGGPGAVLCLDAEAAAAGAISMAKKARKTTSRLSAKIINPKLQGADSEVRG